MRSYLYATFIAFCLTAKVFAAVLENPANNSHMSGLSVASGWKCTAGTITVQFDSFPPLVAGYGITRTDTQKECGDSNNGFGLLFNFNLLGDGIHTMKVFDNGVQFGASTFTITTLGEPFRTGLSKCRELSGARATGHAPVGSGAAELYDRRERGRWRR
jgi:hypothetical protein